jgi:hypothetical protein
MCCNICTHFLVIFLVSSCSNGGSFTSCARTCHSTCREFGDVDATLCIEGCYGGCDCPSNNYFNDNGQCVSVEKCPCYDALNPNANTVLPGVQVNHGCTNW